MPSHDSLRTLLRTGILRLKTDLSIRLRKIGPTGGGHVSARRRVVWPLAFYAVLSAVVVASLLLQMRSEAIVSGEKLVSAFAQLAGDQTTRTIQSVDATLLEAQARLFAAARTGSTSEEAIREQLFKLLEDRPFVAALGVLDAQGHAAYGSQTGYIGLDLSDRPYFTSLRDHPDSEFHLGAAIRNRVTAWWVIPATRALRGPSGEFDGIVAAAVDPRFFDSVWTLEDEIPGLSIALVRIDPIGKNDMVLARVPYVANAIGAPISASPLQSRLRAGGRAGTYTNTSPIDGTRRLFSYRRLAAYPNLVVNVGLSMDQVLAAWWRMLWTMLSGWVLGSAVLAMLTLRLAREWDARRASENRYRLLFDSNPYAAVVIDRETLRVLAVNDAAVKQYGWSREEFQALTADDVYLPEDRPMMAARRQAYSADATRVLRGLRHRKKDGTVMDVELNVRTIDYDGRPAALGIVADVSQRMNLERARELAEEQLRQSLKMEAVGQLTGGIAHDFNNILTVILANADALQEAEELEPELVMRLDQISGAVLRASDLTRSLLAFSRRQALNPRPTAANDLVSAVGKLLRRALGEHVELKAVLASDLWTVNIDRAQLETTLVNLCVNARDAMPAGGTLLVETKNVTLDEDYAAKNLDAAAGDYVMLAVSDTGSGMPPDVLVKVFEPFFTTKEVGKGTGLGLSMVYGFVKQSKGHIKIYSEVGRGTSIKLYLPRGDDAREEAAVRKSPALPTGTERILVVEDDPEVRASVVAQLQSLGYVVAHAQDGTAGVMAFETAAKPYDLLLTDVVMPGALNGKALADEVARRWPETKVVFMSGYTEDAIIHHGRLDPGVLLLSKPFRKSDLAQIVRRALDGAAE